MRKITTVLTLIILGFPFRPAAAGEAATIMLAAAASLRYSLVDELIPAFRAKHPRITVEGTYDSSGKLQAQIENGLAADVFMSAAPRQMKALVDGGFISAAEVVNLLENRIVLIVPAGGGTRVTGFADLAAAETVALGDPGSVPAGQYAREALTSLGIWDLVSARASFGANVTEVLNWVAEGSAEAGVVYATDAATTPKVRVLAGAPEGSLASKVLYPVAPLKGSIHPGEARLLVEFLQSDEALAVFEKYGFTPNR
ncbi:MAG: molybdate ABC transporter substrate-binding protein [Planctomycetota bacterium]|jgi:molybdate transport system substrate-binding protein|nr:molybdate ABC transporter substrate-binding protein [Planctomycetota bacterium]